MSITEKEHQPLISFIITNYNLPIELVRECIDSIFAVSLEPSEREILLIDDGSELYTSEEIDLLKNSVTYIYQKNQGLSAARNTGLENSHGRYIQFIDGDDRLIPNIYNRLIARLKQPDDYLTTIDMLMFRTTHKVHSGRNIATQLNLFWYSTGETYLKKHNLRASACGYIFRKELADGLSFTPGIFHEDEEFTPLLTLRASTMLHTDMPAYFYRNRSGSITTTTSESHIKKRMHDLTEIILRLRHNSLHTSQSLTRRVSQLTMDTVYQAMALSTNAKQLEEFLQPLQEHKLLPLPIRPYTLKYFIFSILTRCSIMRNLLSKILSRK